MSYADYDFYTNEYFGGSIDEESFPRLALRASHYIDYITRGKAGRDAEDDAVKMCCCALAEQYQLIDKAENAANKGLDATLTGSEVQSESVGSWSRSYRSGGDSANASMQSVAELDKGLYAIAQRYLTNTGLLYRGRCF